MDKILELDEKNLITGHIYKITNIKNNKIYIGQVVSHRLNKGKYRPFGYIGRFNDHNSEALNNTKKKQCTYLNNAIRKYGKESFKVELLLECPKNSLDDSEIKYIKDCNSIFPNGYNLTLGGKTTEYVKIKNNEELNKPKKRGHEFGYKHSEETKNKIKMRLADKKIKLKMQENTRKNMKEYYDNKKIETLSKLDLDKDFKKYIRPVYNKDTKELHNYIIRIKRDQKYKLESTDDTLEQKYNRLYSVLEKAYNLSQKNKANKSENCENEEIKTSEMGNQQPSS